MKAFFIYKTGDPPEGVQEHLVILHKGELILLDIRGNFNPYAPLPVCAMTRPSPRANMKRTRYPTFTLDFKWAILMLGEKMTLVQFLDISPLIMARFEKFKNWLIAESVLYHFLVHLAPFRALGA